MKMMISYVHSSMVNHSIEELSSHEEDFVNHMHNTIYSPESEAFIYLSLILASQIIAPPSYPSSLSIHIPASGFAKFRDDIKIDSEMVSTINAQYMETEAAVKPKGCKMTNECGNRCFGKCGPSCTCWNWVCNTCDCVLGCKRHDCCCSCFGFSSLCCLNVFKVRCNGFKTGRSRCDKITA